MTNRFCTKCGLEVVTGKSFCDGCGHAPPTVSVPAQSEPVVIPEPAVAVCIKCGVALTPGKRFCKHCGHAVGESAPVANPVAAHEAIANSAPSVCLQCGAAFAAGQRFCKKCGHAIVSSAPMPAHNDAALSAAAGIATTNAPAWGSTEAGSAQPQPSFATNNSPASPEPLPGPRSQSNAKIGVIIGIAAVVLVLVTAGGVWAWHVYSHRNAFSAARTPNAQQQATPGQPLKPSAGTPGNPVANATQPQSKSGTTTPSRPSSTNALENSTQHIAALTPPSSPLPPPVAPRSGMLHYLGPPVPHNGEVVFDHLPHARLKFTFDHQAWSLTIKPNPDGTKKVTLISQAPGTQMSCDLGWEIIE